MSEIKLTDNLSGNCYEKFPEIYDLLYARYFKSIPKYVDFISKNVTKDAKILEIAAGTGEVTIPLLEKGYNVTSLDLNSGMLAQLEKKAKAKGLKPATIVKNMKDLDFENQFDLIYMRQSINYFIGPDELTVGLKKILRALKANGKFAFNAPNHKLGNDKYPPVANNYEQDGFKAFVLETNTVDSQYLVHSQDSIVWNDDIKPIYVHDENAFYMFTSDEFKKCFNDDGFSWIELFGNNLGELSETDKTIYGVASK